MFCFSWRCCVWLWMAIKTRSLVINEPPLRSRPNKISSFEYVQFFHQKAITHTSTASLKVKQVIISRLLCPPVRETENYQSICRKSVRVCKLIYSWYLASSNRDLKLSSRLNLPQWEWKRICCAQGRGSGAKQLLGLALVQLAFHDKSPDLDDHDGVRFIQCILNCRDLRTTQTPASSPSGPSIQSRSMQDFNANRDNSWQHSCSA